MKNHNAITLSKAAEKYSLSHEKINNLITKFNLTMVCNAYTWMIDRTALENAIKQTIDPKKSLRDRMVVWALFLSLIGVCAGLAHFGIFWK